MGWGCIDFTLVMCMLGSGVRGSVMGVEVILVRMGAGTLESSGGASNTGSVTTISGRFLKYLLFLVLIVFMFDYLIHGWVVSGIVGYGILILTELLPLSSELDLGNIFQFDV